MGGTVSDGFAWFTHVALLMAVVCVLAIIAVIDARHRIISPSFLLVLVVLWFVSIGVVAFSDGLQSCAIYIAEGLRGFVFTGALLLGGALGYEKLRGRQSLGGGDIKLFAVLGLYLGPMLSLFNLLVACVLAVGVVFLKCFAWSKEQVESFSFGPAISVASSCSLLVASALAVF